ncbi:rhodanese-like domain-containing protein [Rhodopirellula sp. P2]|uniref:rhodanese-like domain-containing protein n=1 Tax=Rhodopirellula sp. P2 TaxID=2127060 RepID=UPI002368AAE9|nr:rhodanese-like domain-containing protein [Rhodopirellula sp. P2]WDQ19330.1 rhodanese-like domain-containing protein [Rhodopirellula sp. P2]
MSNDSTLPIEITVADLDAMRARGDNFVLLDVREASEYETARIEGSKLLPMSEIQQRLSELDEHQQDHIVVQCHHGGRSMQVTEFLRSKGFGKVQNLAGGIDQWSLQIDSSVPRY